MIQLTDPLEYIADALTEAGCPAVLDAGTVEFPGCIVQPISYDFNRLDGEVYETIAELIFVAGDVGTTESLTQLSVVVNIAAGLFTFLDVLTAASLQLATDGGSPSPALITRIQVQTNP